MWWTCGERVCSDLWSCGLVHRYCLPPVADAASHAATIAVEAGNSRRTAGDVDLIGDVIGVHSKAPVLPVIVNSEIAKHPRWHRPRIGCIGKRRTDIAHATAEAETAQDAFLESVIGPARRELARRVRRHLADQSRIGIRTVEQVVGGERADDLEARSQISDG